MTVRGGVASPPVPVVDEGPPIALPADGSSLLRLVAVVRLRLLVLKPEDRLSRRVCDGKDESGTGSSLVRDTSEPR